jgi:very-short-patch-repair endonuclease
MSMAAAYHPPYDSPIEDIFAYNYVKYANEDASMEPQVSVQTLCGRFILDFVLTTSDGTRIAVECDGQEFHDFSRDEWRDAMILGEKHVDAIYRIRGADLFHNIASVLYVMSVLDPLLFSSRGMTNLSSLAPNTLRKAKIEPDISLIDFHQSDDDELVRLWMYIRRIRVPHGERRFWQAAYRHALSIGGGPLDEVMQSYRRGDL